VVLSRKRQDESAPNFFQGLGENTCSLQSALKSSSLGLFDIAMENLPILTAVF